MAYDFKKEFKNLYAPKTKPALVDVPAMTFAAVAGCGDPNEEGGAYKQALELLCLLLCGEDVKDGRMAAGRVLRFRGSPARRVLVEQRVGGI